MNNTRPCVKCNNTMVILPEICCDICRTQSVVSWKDRLKEEAGVKAISAKTGITYNAFEEAETIKFISQLLKEQILICSKICEDNSDKILRLITNDENIISDETLTLMQSDANLSRALAKAILNAPEPTITGEDK